MGVSLAERIEQAEASLAAMASGVPTLTARERETRLSVTRTRAARVAARDWVNRVSQAERDLARQYREAQQALDNTESEPAAIAENAIRTAAVAAAIPALRETAERARQAAEAAQRAVASAEAAARQAIEELAAADPELQRAEKLLHAAAGDPYLATQQPAAKAERSRVLDKWRQRRAELEQWLVRGDDGATAEREPKAAKE